MRHLETTLNRACRDSRRIISAVCCLIFLLFSGGCADEPFMGEGDRSPVMLELKVDVPGMNVMTRADMLEGLDKRVETLWVGVYNAVTGKRTGMIAVSDPKTEDHNTTTATVKVEAESGPSYIVAVANYTSLMARDGNGEVELATALQEADTWQKYNDIAVLSTPEGNINTDLPLSALPMSGHYMAGSHADGSYAEVSRVEIPRDGNLPGSIHLRRLISHIKFNIGYAAENISNFEIVDWSVHNVPNQSWLAERTSGTLNSGDLYRSADNPSYQSTVRSNYVERDGNTMSLDWWQMENKRTGRAPSGDLTGYNYREQEYKDASGANTGKYVSLVESATSTDANNNASFLELHVRMSLKVDENGNPLTGQRTVEGVYTIHLGYCEGATEAVKARDFYSRRNTKYTYNVRVNNVNDILVEARNEGEPVPGAEGIVTDITESFQQLDAHYGVYNIYLNNEELSEFQYLIRCYDADNNLVVIDSKETSAIPAAGSAKRKYLDWVEIRPTTSAEVLSPYKPRTGTNSDGETYTLDEFKAGISSGKIKAGYYTVFFNEYVYETSTDGNEGSSTAWKGYVNKPDRQLWLRVLENRSTDAESSYFRAKYAFSQRSIQTYYDIDGVADDALGIEHINESYGLNLRTSNRYANDNSNSPHYGTTDNGRYNAARFIAGGDWNNSAQYLWSNFVTQGTAQSVNAINNIQGVTRDAVTHALPSLVAFTGATSNTYDPDQTSSRKYIDARNACMNRNRDLDGDGYIDAGELRWFIPSGSQYIRMILGRQSLATPIMDYASNKSLASSDNNDLPSLIIYASDGKSIWGMEGISTSFWDNPYYHGYPWNVRCVRLLGIDISQVLANRTLQPAYTHDAANKIVRMSYYDSKSIRMSKITMLPPHEIADQNYNRCYKAFEYSAELSRTVLNGYDTYNSGDWATWMRAVNPCSNIKSLSGSGWRLPNQKEIGIMLRLGIKPSAQYLISGTFSHYDNNGKAVTSINDINSSDYKVMCTTIYGNGTQRLYGDIRGYFVVRCVRDVD